MISALQNNPKTKLKLKKKPQTVKPNLFSNSGLVKNQGYHFQVSLLASLKHKKTGPTFL
jgi:hypothetical protein